MYMKYANIFKGSNLIFGQMPTPSFAQTPTGTEPLWGYRSIERTLMDMHNEDRSTDIGVAFQGNYGKRKLPAIHYDLTLVGYEIMVVMAKVQNMQQIYLKIQRNIYASLLQQKLNFGIYEIISEPLLET